MNWRLALALLALVCGGCATTMARGKVVSQAAFDHDCPEEQVRIVDENTDIWAYRLDVCGTPRKYRDLGNEKEWQFVEITNGGPAVPDNK